jgi:hypothetical protein
MKVDAASLPGSLRQDLGDGLSEPLVRVGDHELDALEAALAEGAQEVRPEDVVLARAAVGAQHGALAGTVTPTATTVATEITRSFSPPTFSRTL